MRNVALRDRVLLTLALLVFATNPGCMGGQGGSEPVEQDVGVVSSALQSAPDTLCIASNYGGHDYWVCPALRNWQDARSKCQSIGFDLASIESSAENQFVWSKVLVNTWIGGSDAAVEGAWRWAASNAQFWQGKGNGSAVGGSFTNWLVIQPDDYVNQDCSLFLSGGGLGKWTDESCSLLAPFICEGDLCPLDPNKTDPGQCGCGAAETDTDNDHVSDCADSCPTDAAKSSPGVCGCGAPETDSDGDGVPNCDDLCPNDAKKIVPGDCGCANQPKPSGTSCGDGLCSANTQCDGAGTCGSSTQCTKPDTSCTYGIQAGVPYWFCNNTRVFSDARQRCQSVGMDLAVVQSQCEDNYITNHTTAYSYLGGTDQTTEGNWFWLPKSSQFWQGGKLGSAVNAAYTNWESNEPSENTSGTKDCVIKDPTWSGAWKTELCTASKAYVCERNDRCPDDVSKLAPGVCGCGHPDVDTDGDGTLDCNDKCPTDPTMTTIGAHGCGAPTCTGSPSSLTPIYQCNVTRADGTKHAVFSVQNTSACNVTVPPGATNAFSPAPAFRGQPTLFEPGLQHAATVPITAAISWTLAGKTATAALNGPACDHLTEQLDAPVVLSASYDHATGQAGDAHAQALQPIQFEIPKTLATTTGIATNATAQLTYVDPNGVHVTCSYVSGSSVLATQNSVELQRGRNLNFVSCSNGLIGGSLATGTQWDLHMTGGDPRWKGTALELHLGKGCSSTLEPALTAEETFTLRQNFNWSQTTALPETTTEPGISSPVPAMRYALIYVETEQQYDLLVQSHLHFTNLPLFPSELERYRGKCGQVDDSGDLRGHFVFSIIPASVYNYLRDQALGGDPIFSAVVLRTIPEARLKNPDGSMSWLKMKESGFRFLDANTIQQPFFLGFVDKLFQLSLRLNGAWDSGNQAIAVPPGPVYDNGAFTDGVRINLHFGILNRDPSFASTAIGDPAFGNTRAGSLFVDRGWGPAHRSNPHGVTVELSRWGSAGSVSNRVQMDRDGNVSLSMPKGGDVRGTGMCISLANTAASIGLGTIPFQVCDFGNLDTVLDGFRHDVPRRLVASDPERHELDVNNRFAYLLTQLTDGYDYAHDVIKTPPGRQAKVGVGYFANLLGFFNGDRWFTPCFSYSDMDPVFDEMLSHFGGVAGDFAHLLFGGPIDVSYAPLRKDMFLPAVAEDNNSRGVMTHEYGHFVMCDAFDTQHSLRKLYEARIIDEELEEKPFARVGMSMESFADFFASQVVSGVNYFVPSADRAYSSPMSYCLSRFCLELNYRGLEGEPSNNRYTNEIARLVSTYHDAFDHNGGWRSGPSQFVPTNGDAWRLSPSPLLDPPSLLPSDGLNSAVDDDRIALPGNAIQSWLQSEADLLINPAGNHLVAMEKGLADQMRLNGATWCDICDLYSKHQYGVVVASDTQQQIWNYCTHITDIIGAPPEATSLDFGLNLDAVTCLPCPAGQFSDEHGICLSCTDPSATVDEGCVACLPNQVLTGGVCTNCPFDQFANRSTNLCETCPADFVLDWSAHAEPSCRSENTPDIYLSRDASCPERFILEVSGLESVASSSAHPSSIAVNGEAHRALAGTECTSSSDSLNAELARIDTTGALLPPIPVTTTKPGQDCVAGCGTCFYKDMTLDSLTPADIQTTTHGWRIVIDTSNPAGKPPTWVNISTTATCLIE